MASGQGSVSYALIRSASAATIVSAVTGERITVVGGAITSAANSFVSFQSSGTATATMAVYRLGGNITAVPLGNSRDGHFQTVAGAALVVEPSAGTCAGHLVYQQSAVT